jgi:integrase
MPAPYGLAVYLMRGCGLRVGEALGVCREDFQNGGLRLQRQLTPDGTATAPMKHRDKDDFRDIPAPGYVLDQLPDTPGPLFPPVTRRQFGSWFNKARDTAGLPANFTPHTLRHVFASVALAGGIPITDVSKWLGHRSIQITYAIYGHLVPASWDRARNVLDEEWKA